MAEVGEPPMKIARRSEEEEENPIFTNPQWNRILSFLTLPDLQNLTQSHSKLKKIVETFVGEGQKVVINRDTLWSHPLATHSALYAKYGRISTNLEIHGVFDDELEILFRHFQSLRELTLRNINFPSIDWQPCPWPTDLVKLSLIGNNILGVLMNYWIKGLHSLVSLHLQSNSGMCFVELKRPSLKILTVIDQYIDSRRFCLPALKTLTMDHFQFVSNLPELEHLKIHPMIDPKYKVEVEALNLKTTEVYYWQVPEDDTPILKLNEDCLLHLQKFLPWKDWMSFRCTHEDFYKLRIPHYELSDSRVKRHDQQLQERFAHLVSSLKIRVFDTKQMYSILPLYTNLTSLSLSQWDKKFINLMPRGIRKLSISISAIDRAYLTTLFKRLNATLRELDLGTDLGRIEGLTKLTRLEKLSWTSFGVPCCLLDLLYLNGSYLRTFKLECTTIDNEPWGAISTLRNLEELTVENRKNLCKIPPIPVGSLAKLKKLTLKGQMEQQNEFFRSLDGTLLEYLYIQKEITPEILRFTNLKQLRVLVLNRSTLLSLVTGLPNLVILWAETKINECLIDRPTRNEMYKHLKQSNRNMQINGAHLGCGGANNRQ